MIRILQSIKFCKSIRILVWVLVCGVVITACGKHDNPVPVTSINYKILGIESDPRYTGVRTAGGSALLESGNMCTGYNCNGVVLYRVKVTGEYDDFKAYDRTCPYEASGSAMEINKAFPYVLVCPDCGSEFNMEGGYMEKGPADYPCREFSCDFYNGDLRLY